jgi:hypothetical protein
MFNFNGGTVGLGTSISPLGIYAGYLLMHSGNYWLAECFLVFTGVYFAIVVAMLCRYVINYRRTRHLLQDGLKKSVRY